MALPKRLYHCLYREPEGNALLPTCNRTVNGKTDHYLFSATHLTKALAFSFSYHEDGDIMCNQAIEGTQNELVLLYGGEETLLKERHIRVFSMSSDGFEEIEGARQAVSTNPMPFDQTNLMMEVTDINDLMEQGLQILLMEESLATLQDENFVEEYLINGDQDPIKRLQDEGRIRWINRERGINSCQNLQKTLISSSGSAGALNMAVPECP